MGPLRGDGNTTFLFLIGATVLVEKMGPLRGDGNVCCFSCHFYITVEKMGPLRGDGNDKPLALNPHHLSREDGSPSWGRKQ